MSTDDTMRQLGLPTLRPPCPSCGSRDVALVLWGMPTSEVIEILQEGDIELGGCCITPDAPDFHCRVCGAAWQDPQVAEL